jgi:hypothetical protein
MEKINISELLKDCPTGMELDCTICDNVYFDEVTPHMIKCFVKNDVYNTIYFHHDGTYFPVQSAKCVIFPKGKTTWDGFKKPFKDGDILTTDLGSVFILKEPNEKVLSYGCYVALNDVLRIVVNCTQFCIKKGCRLATEEEKQKLFDSIKANGYKWNAETKTLEKLIEPKFKVGDIIQDKDGYKVKVTNISIEDECYEYESIIAKGIGGIGFNEQEIWELAPSKFDITTLKPFDRVLVRTANFAPVWTIAFYDGYNPNIGGCFRPFGVSSGQYFQQCIPYEGNEHLRGTTNECSEYYKNWE